MGGEQEQGFEQAFSSLAYAYLADRAPRLIDFTVGFQLVDRNDDNTKAAGVFGFKVGPQWLYAPVFFLNGNLEGHELLYIKGQDMFVPMKENWVNYVLSRKPHVLGEGSPRDAYQMGGMMPNIERMVHPPYGKFAGDKEAADTPVGVPTAPVGSTGVPATPSDSGLLARLQNSAGAILAKPQAVVANVLSPRAPRLIPAPGQGEVPPQRPGERISGMLSGQLGHVQGLAGKALAAIRPPPVAPMGPPAPPAIPPAPASAPAMVPPVATKSGSWPPVPEYILPARDCAAGKFPPLPKEALDDVLPMLAALINKQASFLWRGQPEVKSRTVDMKKLASSPMAAALADAPTLEEFLTTADWRFTKLAWDWSQRYPLIGKAVRDFHGPDFFQRVALRHKAASDAASSNIMPTKPRRRKQASNSILPDELNASIKQAAGDEKVKIKVDGDLAITDNLSDEDKEKVLHHGYLVKDERTGEEVTKVYNTQVRVSLTNPQETGLYEVLERPGEFSRMLIVANPMANDDREHFVTVVRLGDGDKAWLNAHPLAIFARKIEAREEYEDWFAGLGDKDSLAVGGTYMAIGHFADGTCPFTVKRKYGDGRYKVDFLAEMDRHRGRPSNGLPASVADGPPPNFGSFDYNYVSHYDALLVLNQYNGSKLRALNGELHVPENFKFFKLKDPPKPKKDEDGFDDNSILCGPASVSCTDASSGSEEPRPIDPGNISDVQLLFTKKSSLLKLAGDGLHVSVFSKLGTDRVPFKMLVPHLVSVHGVSEQAAEAMCKVARDKSVIGAGQAVSFRVKYAEPYPWGGGGSLQPGPNAPAIPPPLLGTEQRGYNTVNSIYPQEEEWPVQGLEASRTNPATYDPFLNITPDQGALSTAQEAGASGQREIFDVSAIGALLKSVRPEAIVDKYLGALMKSLDALGRLLLTFIWNGDDMADTFGRSEVPDLKDGIRNAFESVGEIVLSLRSNRVEPGIGEEGDNDLEQVAR